MIASPLARRLQLLLLALLVPAASHTLRAQDSVELRSGLVREGKITGVSGGNVRLQMAAGTTGIPLTDVKEVRMAVPPPEFEAASKLLASGDARGAAGALQKLNDTFAGLPVPWARQAMAMLGDAKLASGDTEGASVAYSQLIETYPEATELANLGRARLAVDAGKYDEAAPLLQPILEKSSASAFPGESEGAAFSQAHYLAGRISESTGDNQAALEHYLKATAVFPFDRNAAASAQTRADALRAEHAGLIAP